MKPTPPEPIQLSQPKHANAEDLVRKIETLENRTHILETGAPRLGPNPKQDQELAAERERIAKQIIEAAKQPPQPVDRSCRVLADGSPVPEDESHRELKENGQQKDYVVLCPAERAKGFVRPVRRSYRHLKCGAVTTMSQAIAETYARDPGFYSGTFCVGCGAHFPVAAYGQEGEFVWTDDSTKVGS